MMGWLRSLIGSRASLEDPSSSLDSPAKWLLDWAVPAGSYGEPVSRETALTLSAAVSAISRIADGIACLPWHIYTRGDKGRELAGDHPAYRLLHLRPNRRMSAFVFTRQIMVSLLTDGNAYIIVERGVSRPIQALWVIDPSRVSIKIDEKTGLPSYAIQRRNNEFELRSHDDVIHIAGIGFDGIRGRSPIQHYGQAVFGAALSLDKQAARTARRGAKISGVVEISDALDAEGLAALRKTFNEVYAGSENAGETLFLDAGMKWHPVQMTHRDAQMIELRRFQIAEIARIYNVPLHLLGETDKATSWGTGIEQLNIGFLQYTLLPWITLIDQEFTAKLFGDDSDLYTERDIRGYMMADSKTRAEYYASGVQNGWLKPNEVRRTENLPADDDGDRLMIQTNMSPLGVLGRTGDSEK